MIMSGADRMLREVRERMPACVRNRIEPFIQLGRFYLNYYFRMPGFPKKINMSLSSACQAKCIYCPPDRGRHIRPIHMPFGLAARIFDELAAREYRGHINLGENGEALLNPEFIKILEYMSITLPHVSSQLVSNMNRCDEAISRKVLEVGVSEMHLNIDGATRFTYEYVKGLPFEVMKGNVHAFLRVRNAMGSRCKVYINVLTAAEYLKTTRGVDPEMRSDADEIMLYWKPFLRDGDAIRELRPFMWAGRDEMRIPNMIGCALLSRVVRELFVAPNGECYVCCLDDNAQIGHGNLNQSCIAEVWKGQKRHNILRNLFLKRFKKLGEPCSICLY